MCGSQSVQRMQRVIELARVIRERHFKPIKTPLRELVVVHPDQAFLADLAGEHRTCRQGDNACN